jgi:hypothetical protein
MLTGDSDHDLGRFIAGSRPVYPGPGCNSIALKRLQVIRQLRQGHRPDGFQVIPHLVRLRKCGKGQAPRPDKSSGRAIQCALKPDVL